MSNAFWYSTIYSVSAAFAFSYRYPLLNSGVFLVTVYVTIFEFAWDKSYSFWIEVLISFSPELVNTLAAALIEDDNTSACEIIINMIYNTELKCDYSIAELLYMGLVSDSNRFLFNSCSSNTFSSVAMLLNDYNLNLSQLYEKLYLRPLCEVRLEGYISLNMKVTDQKLGYIIITDDDIIKFGVDSASAGNMINNFNYIKEVLVWVTITEDKKNNQYRVSIRSRGPEINKVAEKYNGGGHKMASGVKVKTLNDALNIVNDLNMELEKYNSLI